jgi:hypothetical protein
MLEEIVDWQPYEHVGWRLAVPGIGPVAATADLEAVGDATRLRVRWQHEGDERVDGAAIAAVRAERDAAFARLGQVVAGALQSRDRHEVAS